MLIGLVGICVGTYAVLDATAPRYLAGPMLVVGVLVAGAGLLSAGRRVERTRYRPDHWQWPELVVVASGILVATIGWWMAHHQIDVSFPALTSFPPVSALALVMAALGLLGALCAPPPARPQTQAPVRLRQEVTA